MVRTLGKVIEGDHEISIGMILEGRTTDIKIIGVEVETITEKMTIDDIIV